MIGRPVRLRTAWNGGATARSNRRMRKMSETTTLPKTSRPLKEKEEHKVKRQPPYHVILHNDDDHSFEYVIHMLQKLFGHPPEKGYQMAYEVHTQGKVIVLTTALEVAELK